MLTATYALISLSVEQKRAHNLLSTVQQLFQNSSADRQRIDPTILESVVSQFTKLDESCHRRKVEVYVIPAIQKATKEADSLLAELESLSAIGLRILRSVRERVRQAFDQGVIEVKELYSSIELYCTNLLQRLTKEEEELLPLAERVISSEEWFAIGAQFLSLYADKKPAGNPWVWCGDHWRRRLAIPCNPSWGQPENFTPAFRNAMSVSL